MKTKLLMLVVVPLSHSGQTEMSNANWYVIGAIIAFLIMGYLVYSLLKPEKF